MAGCIPIVLLVLKPFWFQFFSRYNFEEKANRESMLVGELRELLEKRQKVRNFAESKMAGFWFCRSPRFFLWGCIEYVFGQLNGIIWDIRIWTMYMGSWMGTMMKQHHCLAVRVPTVVGWHFWIETIIVYNLILQGSVGTVTSSLEFYQFFQTWSFSRSDTLP